MPFPSAYKNRLARVLARTMIVHAADAIQRRLHHPFIRVVNYHSVSRRDAAAFEAQLAWYRRSFVPVDEAGLLALLNGEWQYPNPGLIISFDDGLRTDYDVAAPLLEKHGFTGWFFVSVGLLQTSITEQRSIAREMRIAPSDEYDDGRVFVSEDELRMLARKHVIGCHTSTHVRLREGLTPDQLCAEVAVAKNKLESVLSKEVTTFCWVGGEETSYSRSAAKVIAASGYKLSFMTNSQPVTARTNPLQLQRTNVEASEPIELVALKLSGLVDLYYYRKRRRVNHLTAVNA
jgi:peptidoglycan/xylan/chitin deacetylase (PgdA/CDA1 family)